VDGLPPETVTPNDPAQAAAAEKRDLLARLLGRLAHEIRNPLSSLDIHVQLLQEDLAALPKDTNESATARLEIIRGELHRLERIVERFLRLAGPSEIDPEPAALGAMIKQVAELLRPEAESRGIQLVTRIDTLPPVMADPVRLLQALMNVVINAVQAVGRNGRVELAASVSGNFAVVQVMDNGHGIPSDKLSSVFDLYFTTKEEGHGLGLWIAQQIVSAHNGRLEAHNRPEGGAVFTMSLPLAGSPKDPDQAKHG
jgi:two-component system sensor histidine kinase HydH